MMLAVVLSAACATTGAAPGFREGVTVERPALPASELFDVCWREGAPASVKLTFMPDDVMFESTDNSTGRCVREIAQTYPWGAERPSGELIVTPKAPGGWAVLAWVKLLSVTRFGPERGLLDPAPLVAACLQKGGVRSGTSWAIRWSPSLRVEVLPAGALTDTERCVEAVLGATAWPSTRAFTFSLPAGGPAPAGDVAFYFWSEHAVAPLEAQRAHDALALVKGGVGVCWEAALNRRAGLGGGRTVRITVGEDGAVSQVAVGPNQSNSPTSAADYLLDKCLVDTVKAARFGPGAGDTAYSWVFGDRAG